MLCMHDAVRIMKSTPALAKALMKTWGMCVLPRAFVCCEAQSEIPAAGLGVAFACPETWHCGMLSISRLGWDDD
jgi:hypothetical protein